MTKLLYYLTCGILLIVLQTAILPQLLNLQLRPDLLLLLVIYISLKETSCCGAFYAWGLGCLLDVFSGTTLGLYGVIMLITFSTTCIVGKQLDRDNDMTRIAATLVGTLGQTFLLIILLLAFSDSQPNWFHILNQLPMQLLLNLATVVVLIILSQPFKHSHTRKTLHTAIRRSKPSWH